MTRTVFLAIAVLLKCPLDNLHAADKPNILIFYADDLGYGELGCYGEKQVPTPNIDSIAASGIRFTQGYVSAPLCSPSRAGLMTGRYQTRFGHENNQMAEGRGLPLSETTLADRLRALGYSTGMVGKWHLGNDAKHLPMARGFGDYYGVVANPGSYFTPRGFIDSRVSADVQEVTDKDFYTTDAFAARAVDWIERHKDGPWFLYLPFNAVHAPLDATNKYLNRVSQITDKNRRTLAAMRVAMDDAVGMVMKQVRTQGQENNTLVFFISDNGSPGGRDGNGPLRGSKHTTWEGGIRLPFLAQWKGTFPAGKVYEQSVVQLDVLPTCVAAAGGTVDPTWNLDGVNLLPFLAGQNDSRPHETLYWRIDGRWAIRHGDWKLVVGTPDAGEPELFDLSKDLGEQHNLASAQPDKAKELKSLWDRWNQEQAKPVVPKEKAKRKKAAEKTKKKGTE